jgi:hypothetical protein
MNIRGLSKSFVAECWVGEEYQSSGKGMLQDVGAFIFYTSARIAPTYFHEYIVT